PSRLLGRAAAEEVQLDAGIALERGAHLFAERREGRDRDLALGACRRQYAVPLGRRAVLPVSPGGLRTCGPAFHAGRQRRCAEPGEDRAARYRELFHEPLLSLPRHLTDLSDKSNEAAVTVQRRRHKRASAGAIIHVRAKFCLAIPGPL